MVVGALVPWPLLLPLVLARAGGGVAEAACAAAEACGAPACGAGLAAVPPVLLQKAAIHSSAVTEHSDEDACLCVFDVDRTLTGKQGRLGPTCPRNSLVEGVGDPAYGGGTLTLSALGSAGLGGTFCGGCYLGVCSAGTAGGGGSAERRVLAERVLTSGPQRRLLQRTPRAKEWSYGEPVTSPFVLSQPDRTKHRAVVGIVNWYRNQGIAIRPERVHFFGDRTENIGFFRSVGFNAREISCGSRDLSIYHGMVGLCGATPQEITSVPGVQTCEDTASSVGSSGCNGPQCLPLDSSPGQYGSGVPMSTCQGDCDSDSECAGSLRCFQRDAQEPVPGCSGLGVWDFDYCYEPSVGRQPTGQPKPPATPTPTPSRLPPELDSSRGKDASHLQACQGDCDSDSDCVGGLRCFQRDAQEPVPGCSGLGIWEFDYCYEPAAVQPPVVQPTTVQPPATEPPSVQPPAVQPPAVQPPELDSSPGVDGLGKPGLLVCQGDCDEDGDCADGLRCFQRSGQEAVPGCNGLGIWNFDYCYEPAANKPEEPREVVSQQQTAREPLPLDSSPGPHGTGLGRCQGDCDRDDDCAGGLRCFQRDEYYAVPGCDGPGVRHFDYCYEPADGQPKEEQRPKATEATSASVWDALLLDSSAGAGGAGYGSLQRCQGDCDRDEDCAGQLRCFQRNGEAPVPGCSGRGIWDFDYCVHPTILR